MNKGARSIEQRLLQPSGDAERVGRLLDLGARYADRGQPRDGLRAAREALEVARALHDPVAIGHALSLAARCHIQRDDSFSAIASGIDALAAFAGNEPAARADVLRVVGLALAAFEDLDTAESAVAEAARLSSGEDALHAAACEAHGRVLAQRGRSQVARCKLRRAAAIYRRLDDRAAVKRLMAQVAHTYREEADEARRKALVEQARLQWRHAGRVYRTALAYGKHAAYDAEILTGLAACECGLGDIDAAYEHAGMAASLAAGAGAGATLARARLCEGRALQAMGRTPGAERACSHAVSAAEAARDERLLIECLRAQARFNDELGRFETAAGLEERARGLEQERAAALACLRAELAPLLDRRRLNSDA